MEDQDEGQEPELSLPEFDIQKVISDLTDSPLPHHNSNPVHPQHSLLDFQDIHLDPSKDHPDTTPWDTSSFGEICPESPFDSTDVVHASLMPTPFDLLVDPTLIPNHRPDASGSKMSNRSENNSQIQDKQSYKQALEMSRTSGIDDLCLSLEDSEMDDGRLDKNILAHGFTEYDNEDDPDDYDDDDDDDDDDVPDEIGTQMNAAMGSAGSTHNYRQVLWEDNDALREIGEHLGESSDTLFTGKMGRHSRKNRIKKPKLTRSQAKIKIPDELQGTFGKANIAYAMGKHDEAIEFLYEIIRQAPNSQQAWATLAMVHEELGNKQKSLQSYLMAVHLSPKDIDLWKRLALMSEDMGDISQALYCLNKASRVDPDDLECKWSRSLILRDLGRLEQAIDGLQDILQIIPGNVDVVKELARIYVRLEDIPQAIGFFESLMDMDEAASFASMGKDGVDDDLGLNLQSEYDATINTSSDPKPTYRMGFEELNMLSELYIEVGEYEKAIAGIKQGITRLCGEPLELIDYDTDDEFLPSSGKNIVLPTELRTKLGICRLYLGDSELAQCHFSVLYASDIEMYSELFFDVAEAYMGCRKFSSALGVLECLTRNEPTNVSVTWSRMARCNHQLGNTDMAIKLYRKAIKSDPDDAEIKRSLAEIYEVMGNETLALEYFQEARHVEDALKQTKSDTSKRYPVSTSLMVVQNEEKRRQTRLAEDKNLARARALTRHHEILSNFKIFKDLSEVQVLDSLQKIDLLRSARKLMSRFQSCPLFYSTYRVRTFFEGTHSKPANGTVNPDTTLETENIVSTSRSSLTGMRDIDGSIVMEGLALDDWLGVFVKYAIIIAKDKKYDDAHAALTTVLDAVVFHQSKPKLAYIRTIMLYVAVYSRDYSKVSDICRTLAQSMPYSNDAYRLYCAMFTAGSAAVTLFASSPNLKYFTRQIRAIEGNTPAYGNLLTEYPLLHILHGHILSLGRVYNGAIEHYMCAYSASPDDPMVNFALGSAHLHRAMQRKSDSRHIHVIQGFTFLFRYAELRDKPFETDYNLGRAFHMLGLTHLAVPYYRKVVDEKQSQFSHWAAYNLSLIYISVGSYGLSQRILQQHCTF
ncbi:hypothetical protein BASA61_008515 [Batrachochytrium salamandrivorans]|nr:hypothetical protein BASA61_008515 [Batrachochytrium salamandrivorans]KAH9269865.1 hypothetical protein BASA83_008013 [Batrachochytrium salamandrivorans]KAJ1342258.1 hypothetical protein BSLG_003181 [Batrachochytrium salamandrivorans]